MNKKAFTLVELLAVIVILAIIALIAVPMILNQIETAKKKALEDSAYGIIEAGKFFYLENMVTATGINEVERYDFEVINKKFVNIKNANQSLAFTGKMPKNGILQINSNGNTALAICDEKYCACKSITDVKVAVQEVNCNIDTETGEILSEIKDGTPTGMIVSYLGNDAPKGYLKCDGSVYTIAEYPSLAEQIKEQFGSYNYYGGDGTTTFAIPDLRGEFLRGTGTASRNTGTGVGVGIHQDATLIPSGYQLAANGNLYFGHSEKKNEIPLNYDSITSDSVRTAGFRADWVESALYRGVIGSITTRPTNTSVLYCIKY